MQLLRQISQAKDQESGQVARRLIAQAGLQVDALLLEGIAFHRVSPRSI